MATSLTDPFKPYRALSLWPVLLLAFPNLTFAAEVSYQAAEAFAYEHAWQSDERNYLVVARRNVVSAVLKDTPDSEAWRLIELAQRQYDLASIERLYRKALARFPDAEQPQRWGVLYLLGRTVLRADRAAEAVPLLQAAHDLAVRCQPPKSTAVFATNLALGWVLSIQGNKAEALPSALKAAELLEREGLRTPLEELQEYANTGDLLVELSELDRAEPLLLAALRESHFDGSVVQLEAATRASAFTALGKLKAARQEIEPAINYFKAALQSWNEVRGSRSSYADKGYIHYRLAELWLQHQQLGRAVKAYRAAMRQYEMFGDPITRAVVMSELGRVLVEQREYAPARDVLRESYTTLKQAGHSRVPFSALAYGRALAGLERYAAAEVPLLEAMNGFQQQSALPEQVIVAALQLGRVRLFSGNACKAQATYYQALQLWESLSPDKQAALPAVREAVMEGSKVSCTRHG